MISFKTVRQELVMTVGVLLAASAGFGIGRISERMPTEQVQVTQDDKLARAMIEPCSTAVAEKATPTPQPQSSPSTVDDNFVASKTGKKYYPRDCPSAKRISEANKITFKTEDEAKAQGYELAAGCKTSQGP